MKLKVYMTKIKPFRYVDIPLQVRQKLNSDHLFLSAIKHIHIVLC